MEDSQFDHEDYRELFAAGMAGLFEHYLDDEKKLPDENLEKALASMSNAFGLVVPQHRADVYLRFRSHLKEIGAQFDEKEFNK